MTETATPFFEAGGQRWPLRITPPLARKIRDKIGLDLFDVDSPASTNPIVRLVEKPMLLADVLWEICQPLAAERGISREQLEEAAWSDVDAVADAIVAGVLSGFPEKKRERMRKLFAAISAAADAVVESVASRIESAHTNLP